MEGKDIIIWLILVQMDQNFTVMNVIIVAV